MGKPFKEELKKLSDTIRWAELQDVTRIEQFLFAENKQAPLVRIGSGGSLSACHYAVQLYQQRNGVLAQAMTPLQMMYSGKEIIRSYCCPVKLKTAYNISPKPSKYGLRGTCSQK